MITVPRVRAASPTCSASAALRANGFSVSTALPAWMAARFQGA
jgi:hypothetical protein